MVVADSVKDTLGDAGIVRHHETVPAPLVAEHVGKQPLVDRSGHVVDHVERSHKASGAGVGRGLVAGHVFVEHPLAGHVDRVVVAAGLSAAVEGEVLDAGHDLVFGDELLARAALVAVDHSLGHTRIEVGVFPAAFAHTAPPGVTAKVDHRAEGPRDTVGRSLYCSYMGGLLDCFHIEAGRKAERNREHCLIAMNHVHAENQRDAEPRLLYRDLLVATDLGRALHVEKAADFAVCDTVFHTYAHALTGHDGSGYGQIELSGFLLEGHFLHEAVDECVHLGIAVNLSVRATKRKGGKQHKTECFFHIVIIL